jgi:hypothetical protein
LQRVPLFESGPGAVQLGQLRLQRWCVSLTLHFISRMPRASLFRGPAHQPAHPLLLFALLVCQQLCNVVPLLITTLFRGRLLRVVDGDDAAAGDPHRRADLPLPRAAIRLPPRPGLL